jgi:hypothetical protein
VDFWLKTSWSFTQCYQLERTQKHVPCMLTELNPPPSGFSYSVKIPQKKSDKKSYIVLKMLLTLAATNFEPSFSSLYPHSLCILLASNTWISDNTEQERNHIQVSTALILRKPSMMQLLHFKSNLIITNDILTDNTINIACSMTTRYWEYYLHFVPKLHRARYFMPRHFRLSGHQTIA